MIKSSSLFILLIMMVTGVSAQEVIPLYEGAVPGSKPSETYTETSQLGKDGIARIGKVTTPTLTVFRAPKEKATGTSVIICPGGGYSILAIGHEGFDVAKRFNEIGVTAFVLKYRLPSDEIMVDKTYALLQDAQQAIYLVRKNAKAYGIKPNKIGILGFSAGGHFASTLLTHYDDIKIEGSGKISLRPDFGVLVYPVISFEESVHTGTMKNLLGPNPTDALKHYFSANKNVSAKTPPLFLVHAKDDKTVPVANSILLNEALRRNKVHSEIYLYENGGHGFGLKNKTSEVDWFNLLTVWMKKEKF
jgi:acetyl esterase/lipase